MRLLMFTLFSLILSTVFAMNGRTTYRAKIIKPDGSPLEAANVDFKFSVLDTTGNCTIYTETYSALNMTGTGGLVSFSLGSGIRGFPSASATTAVFANVFDNTIASMPCEASGIYTPNPTDTRKIVMQFNEGNGWHSLPAMTMNSVPYAIYAAKSVNAMKLNGKSDTDFLQKNSSDIPTCAAGTMLYFNNASFSCVPTGSGSGGGTAITSVSTNGSVLYRTGTLNAPVINIYDVTTSRDGYLKSSDYNEFKAKLAASGTQIIKALGYDPVSAAGVTSQIENYNFAGDVVGKIGSTVVNTVGGKPASQVAASVNDILAATASSTVSTLVKRNASGNITVNNLYASAAKLTYLDIYKPSSSFNIRFQAPTNLNASYVLNLPPTSGTVGQIISNDGSGNLVWVSPKAGEVVNVNALAPLASTGGSSPIISIPQASFMNDGYLSSADWNTFNSKITSSSAAIAATLGFTPANSTVVNAMSVTVNSLVDASSYYSQKANNLSDLTNISQARTNLGLGSFATASTLDLGSASATGTLASARLPDQTGVTNGAQYTKVTVDIKGRVTSGAQLASTDVTTALGYTPANSATLSSVFIQKTGDTMTGLLQLKTGSTTVAPLKFTSGTLLTSPTSGSIEFDGFNVYFTDGTNTRRRFASMDSTGAQANTSIISNTSNITLAPTGSVVVSSTTASTNSSTGALTVAGGLGVAGNIFSSGTIITSSNLQGSSLVGTNSVSSPTFYAGAGTAALPSRAFSTDTATGTWQPASGSIAISTAGLERMRVTSAGSVGIGTTSPAAKLDVSGTVKLGASGGVITGMGTCSFTQAVTTSDATATCTGVPASVNVIVSCSPTSSLSAATGIVYRATGTLSQISMRGTAAVSSATFSCYWVQP